MLYETDKESFEDFIATVCPWGADYRKTYDYGVVSYYKLHGEIVAMKLVGDKTTYWES